MRGPLLHMIVCVAVGGFAAVGCAKPGQVQTQRVKPASEETATNPGAVLNSMPDVNKKSGAMKK